jgi:hypothetical protein
MNPISILEESLRNPFRNILRIHKESLKHRLRCMHLLNILREPFESIRNPLGIKIMI